MEGSRERFDQLCALLGDGIIGTTWTYASREKDVMLASLQALPAVVDALGVGAARYLRVRSRDSMPRVSSGGSSRLG